MTRNLSDYDKTYNQVVSEINKRDQQIIDLLNERNKLATAAEALVPVNLFQQHDIKAAK